MVHSLPYSYLRLPISQEWPFSDPYILLKSGFSISVSESFKAYKFAIISLMNFRVEIPFYKSLCVIILNVRIKPYKSIKHFYVMLAIRLNSFKPIQ